MLFALPTKYSLQIYSLRIAIEGNYGWTSPDRSDQTKFISHSILNIVMICYVTEMVTFQFQVMAFFVPILTILSLESLTHLISCS